MYGFASVFFTQSFIDEIKSLHSIFIAFVSGPFEIYKCQIMTFAFFCTMIHKLTEEKIVPLKSKAYIIVLPIVSNTDLIYFITTRSYFWCTKWYSKSLLIQTISRKSYALPLSCLRLYVMFLHS